LAQRDGRGEVVPVPDDPRTSARSFWQHPLIVGVVLAVVGGAVTVAVTKLTTTPTGGGDTPRCASDVTEEFVEASLSPEWSVQNEGEVSLAAGTLQIAATDGSDVRFDLEGGVTAPWIGRPIGGDFSISTAVAVDPQFSYQGAGILVYRDAGNYVRLERGFAAVDSVVLEYSEDGRYQKVHGPFDGEGPVPVSATDVELRLERRGVVVTAAWKPTGAEEWRQISGSAPLDGDATAGVVVVNRSQPPNPDPDRRALPAQFDYVQLGCVG
jgi:beta-xylosidase